MADILIRGMELESGKIAEILIAPDGNVYRNRREFCLGFGPIAHATKIPPHGDLIDRNEILKQSPDHWDEEYIEGDDEYVYRYYLDSTIEDAPVIIPAEGASNE